MQVARLGRAFYLMGFVSYNMPRQIGGDADFEISGLELDATVLWARFVTPPVFGVALSLITHRIIPYCLINVKC